MKLKDELANVQAVFSENLDRIKEYAPQLKASGRYKVFENRLAWDCLKAFVGVDTLCSWYDKYGCTDTHIESVGRAGNRSDEPQGRDRTRRRFPCGAGRVCERTGRKRPHDY